MKFISKPQDRQQPHASRATFSKVPIPLVKIYAARYE